MNDLLSIILLAGAAQGVILSSVLLTTSRGNRTANRILGSNTLLFSLAIVLFLLRPQNVDTICFSCLIFQVSFFIQAPLIYLYVNALTQPSRPLTRKSFLHLVPFAFAVLAYGVIYRFIIPADSVQGLGLSAMLPYISFMNWLIILDMMIYISLSFRLLFRHGANILNTHANIERISLNWLKLVLFCYVVIWTIPLVFKLFFNGCGYETWGMICAVYSVLMYVMGYLGLLQPDIFFLTPKKSLSDEPQNTPPTPKYEKSTLTDHSLKHNTTRLLELMDDEELFLDNEITLSRLAARLNLSTHHLSQIINDGFNQNFYEFINSRRIDSAKKMLTDKSISHLTISTIAFDAGFNSISAFNASFKKFTGTTPSKYRSASLT